VNSTGQPPSGNSPWNWNSSTCTFNNGIQLTQDVYSPTTTIATSTNIKIYGAFSAGEVLIALFLFLLIVIELSKTIIAQGLSNIKTKKKFLGYSGGDVEVREDL
jgi:hypothetical protein